MAVPAPVSQVERHFPEIVAGPDWILKLTARLELAVAVTVSQGRHEGLICEGTGCAMVWSWLGRR